MFGFFLFGLAIELIVMSVLFVLLILLWFIYVIKKRPSSLATFIGTLMLCSLYFISAISLVRWEFWAQDEDEGLHKAPSYSTELRQESTSPPSTETARQMLDSGSDPNADRETDSSPTPASVRALVVMSLLFALLILLCLFYVIKKRPSPPATFIGTLMLCAVYFISAISLACWDFWAQVTDMRLHIPPNNSVEWRQESPPSMETAINLCDVDMARQMLDSGFDPNADIETDAGPTPALVKAADERDEEIVRLLLERGAKIHPIGDEALAAAAAHGQGYENIVKMLKEAGAHPLPSKPKKSGGEKKGKPHKSQ